jgi:hypothetical protein
MARSSFEVNLGEKRSRITGGRQRMRRRRLPSRCSLLWASARSTRILAAATPCTARRYTGRQQKGFLFVLSAGMFTMHAPQFDMQINLTGKKIGTCDNPK